MNSFTINTHITASLTLHSLTQTHTRAQTLTEASLCASSHTCDPDTSEAFSRAGRMRVEDKAQDGGTQRVCVLSLCVAVIHWLPDEANNPANLSHSIT